MISFITKSFKELSNTELYQLLQLRSEVFVVEQNCVYLDMDNKDEKCYHVLGYENGKLVACTRLVPPGISYESEPSIGRVVTHPSVRQSGYGKLLMEYSIAQIKKLFGSNVIVIGAQSYLDRFYQNLGFVPEGEEYLEDNIPHRTMRLRK
ncbi:MAG: family N-acetyltransferase [Bacteroidetes bacterium]|jgi:ElaA protein|nr:family N-acetyltransferase [Bacteroidota bacterium]MDF2452282.1 family N-acetyltransferase [Bacteroidota bacterium]